MFWCWIRFVGCDVLFPHLKIIELLLKKTLANKIKLCIKNNHLGYVSKIVILEATEPTVKKFTGVIDWKQKLECCLIPFFTLQKIELYVYIAVTCSL